MLLKNLDEKDKEINDLRQVNSDLEIQISKYKSIAEESKKNHEYLLNNYKSAEKLSYFQNKVSQLSEEKAIILQTNSETIKNLTNEINELNLQLNEYKKKELDNLKINSNSSINQTFIENKNKNLDSLNNKPEINNNAELFFEKEFSKNNSSNELNLIDQSKSKLKNPFEINEKENIKVLSSPKVENEENSLKNQKRDDTSNANIDNKKETIVNSQTKKDQGFFTRFIAPIFLTENELNNLNQD